MKQIKLNLGLMLGSVLAVSVLAVGPVSARGINSGNTSGSGSTSGSTETAETTSGGTSAPTTETHSSTSGTGTATETEHAPETQTETEPTTGKVDDLRSRAAKMLATDRQDKKPASTAAERQKACQARQANLNTKITNFGAQGTRHLTSLNSTYDKIKAFQTANQLNVADYATLVAAADAQQASATTAVAALKTVTVTIDCSSPDPAASVATVKSAVKNARVALQSYRTSIKNVLVALMTAKEAAHDSSTSTDTQGATQ